MKKFTVLVLSLAASVAFASGSGGASGSGDPTNIVQVADHDQTSNLVRQRVDEYKLNTSISPKMYVKVVPPDDKNGKSPSFCQTYGSVLVQVSAGEGLYQYEDSYPIGTDIPVTFDKPGQAGKRYSVALWVIDSSGNTRGRSESCEFGFILKDSSGTQEMYSKENPEVFNQGIPWTHRGHTFQDSYTIEIQ